MKINVFFLLVLIVLTSCSKDEPTQDADPGLKKGVSFIVLNEGAFGQGNATLCVMDGSKERDCSIFEDINNMPIGDVLQSGMIMEEQLYLVVNGSGRLIRIALPELTVSSSIDQLAGPREILPVNTEKAYVSDIYANAIHIIQLSDLTLQGNISFPGWSEKMIRYENEVWVTNPELFGAGPTDQVFILDIETDMIVDSIQTGRNPVDITNQQGGDIWVLSSGNPIDMDSAILSRIDPISRNIKARWNLPPAFSGKITLSQDGEKLAIMLEDIFILDVLSGEISRQHGLSDRLTVPYGIAFSRGDADRLWVSDAGDFVSEGTIILWDLSAEKELDRRVAGINPNSFIFY